MIRKYPKISLEDQLTVQAKYNFYTYLRDTQVNAEKNGKEHHETICKEFEVELEKYINSFVFLDSFMLCLMVFIVVLVYFKKLAKEKMDEITKDEDLFDLITFRRIEY